MYQQPEPSAHTSHSGMPQRDCATLINAEYVTRNPKLQLNSMLSRRTL